MLLFVLLNESHDSKRVSTALNFVLILVPRYENAAKSNYWTMTREGFEEFGNENSFKRRRRRGATLAPISAYKAKKYSNESTRTMFADAIVVWWCASVCRRSD